MTGLAGRPLCLLLLVVTLVTGLPAARIDVVKERNKRAVTDNVHVYYNGNIYTVDKSDATWNLDPQQAMVVDVDGKITYVGTESEAFFRAG